MSLKDRKVPTTAVEAYLSEFFDEDPEAIAEMEERVRRRVAERAARDKADADKKDADAKPKADAPKELSIVSRMNALAAVRRATPISLYGTSEGIIKGWETRRAGGGPAESDKDDKGKTESSGGSGGQSEPTATAVAVTKADDAPKRAVPKLVASPSAPPKDKPITVVFGGSFNPPHTGHEQAVNDAVAMLEQDGYTVGKVIVAPTAEKLLKAKLGDSLYPLEDRVAMAKRTFRDKRIEVSDGPALAAEAHEGKLRRTQLADWAQERNGGTTVVNVTGEDAAPGHPPGFPSVYEGDKGSSHEGYHYLAVPRGPEGASSSKIRAAIRNGETVPDMTPEAEGHLREMLKKNPQIKLRVDYYDLYGTSEGIIKGWETRRRGDGPADDDKDSRVPRGEEPVLREELGKTRPIPIKTKELGKAVDLILKGEVVELENAQAANALLNVLAKAAKDSKDGKIKEFDLCKVSVAGTNLFCGSPVKTPEFPNGIPRIAMPQLAGAAVPGSAADKLPKTPNGMVNAADAFLAHLAEQGIPVKDEEVAASDLFATQADMKGDQVAGMMTDPTYHPEKEPIFISSDGYVLDGHHRWAAVVGRDAEDGKLGQSTMRVRRVNAPISELLRRAKTWTTEFGIQNKAGSKKTSLRAIFDGSLDNAYRARLAQKARP